MALHTPLKVQCPKVLEEWGSASWTALLHGVSRWSISSTRVRQEVQSGAP